MKEPAPGCPLAIVYSGVLAPEALAAHEQLLEDIPAAGVLAVTSADKLHRGWLAAIKARGRGAREALSHVEGLLSLLAPGAALVTVTDGHPTALSWLGAVGGHPISPLWVDSFGQSGNIDDLYRLYQIDAEALVNAAAEVTHRRRAGRGA